ncbi:MAG: hypothetical protein RR472_03300 [Anaerovoracaceae bacterium]
MINLTRLPKKYHKECIKLWKEYDKLLLADKIDIEFEEYIYEHGSKEYAKYTRDKLTYLRAEQAKLDREGNGGRIN